MPRFLVLFTALLVIACQPPRPEKSHADKTYSNSFESDQITLSDLPAALEKFRRSSEETLLPQIDFKVTEFDYTFGFILSDNFMKGNAGKVSDDLKVLSSFGYKLLDSDSANLVGSLSQEMANFTAEKICQTGNVNQYEESVESRRFFYIHLKKEDLDHCSEQIAEFAPLFRHLRNYEGYIFKKGLFPLALGGYLTTLAENELFQMRAAILSEADMAKEWKVGMARDVKNFIGIYLEFEEKMREFTIRDEKAETLAFDPVQRESIQTLARDTLLRLDFQSTTNDDHFENVKKLFRVAVESLELYASESNKIKIDYYRN